MSNQHNSAVDSLEPIADASEWIEQLSKPYREVPWAVIRELFQNASDAIQDNQDDRLKLIELAILCKETKPSADNFHIVIRDSGQGMSDEEIRKYLRVLGAGTKRGSAQQIGQFGVGFFSTHAICIDVRIVTRKIDTGETVGWEYVPGLKRFFRLSSETINSLTSRDFENHPNETRKRTHGTSVYLNINFEDHPQCEEWLIAESLVGEIRRDFFILPAPIYIADYSEGYPGRKILDGTGREVHEIQLNLAEAPWEVEGHRQTELAKDLLQFRLPHIKRTDLPLEYYAFKEKSGGGCVSGFMWLAENSNEGTIDLLLKRMWVECAKDVHPLIATSAFGIFNITPDKPDLDVNVSPQRDHIIRDSHFRTARKAMQRGLVELFVVAGQRCVQQIRDAVVSLPDLPTKIDAAKSVLEKSAFVRIMETNRISFGNLLSDIPLAINDALEGKGNHNLLAEFAVRFVNRRISTSIDTQKLNGAFEAMQKMADTHQVAEELAVTREPLHWSPDATRDFLKRVGPYLPVPLALRERRKDGGFNVKHINIPLLAASALNPACASKLLVLTKGSVAEFLSKETTVGGVVYPAILRPDASNNDNFCLVLAIIGTICSGIPEIEFIEYIRDLLKPIVNRDDWIPLIEGIGSIINAAEERGNCPRIEVDALGYLGEKAIPLLWDKNGNERRLIINAYNPLMQDMLSAFTSAGERNDTEARELIAHICHELYHHTMPVEYDPVIYDHHAVTTRNTVFLQTISILRKYADARQ